MGDGLAGRLPAASAGWKASSAVARRRDGVVVRFDPGRIRWAGSRAAREAGIPDPALGTTVATGVAAGLAARFGNRPPGVEDVQDAVERALVTGGFADVARAFAVDRRQHAELRRAKQQLGVRDELKLGLGAVAVLKDRYPAEGSQGECDRVDR